MCPTRLMDVYSGLPGRGTCPSLGEPHLHAAWSRSASLPRIERRGGALRLCCKRWAGLGEKLPNLACCRTHWTLAAKVPSNGRSAAGTTVFSDAVSPLPDYLCSGFLLSAGGRGGTLSTLDQAADDSNTLSFGRLTRAVYKYSG